SPTAASLTQAPTVAQNYTQSAGGGVASTPRSSTSSPNNILGASPPSSNPNNNTQREPEPLVLAGQFAPPYNNNGDDHAPVGQYQRGTMPRSAVPNEQRDSRFASVITVLILL